MKLKKSQRTVALFDQSYSHLYYCIIYVFFAICLIDFGWHRVYADVYVHHANNLTNSFQQYRPHVHAMNASLQNEWFRKRNGRFLFDAFFGIDTPQIEADEFEEDDDEGELAAKPCKCGKCTILLLFFFGCFAVIEINNQVFERM